MFKKTCMALFITFCFAGPANAWYFELSDIYTGGTYGYYAVDLSVHGDPGDVLNDMSISVSWDAGNLTSIDYQDYLDSLIPERRNLWDGGIFPEDYSVPGEVHSINGSEPPGNPGVFFFEDYGLNYLATLWFGTTDPQDVTFIVYSGTMAPDSVTMNDIEYVPADLCTYDGDHKLTAIPIPGAVYLLASGLIGLIGLRHRMRDGRDQ